MKEKIIELDACCACGSSDLHLALDLGTQPLANSYLKHPSDFEEQFPLRANVCGECQHVQLSHAVNPDLLFKHYLYVSGTTKTLIENMIWFANFVVEYCGSYHGRILDIGCNDGTQLNAFKSLKWRTFGIDPAANVTPIAEAKGHKITTDYFNADSAIKLIDVQPDAIVAQNVVAHNYDAVNFLRNVRQVMKPTTKFFMQISQADMIRNNEFDTCYHEHINFFNVKSLTKIAERAGLHIEDIVRSPIHGNSYIVIMGRQMNRSKYRIQNLMNIDAADGLYDLDTYVRWGENARKLMDDLVKHVEAARQLGYKVVGYGAAAKGMVVTNFAKLELDFIIDDNPLKQGHFTPGMHTPIVAITELAQYKDDKIMFVPLAWNFFAEITKRVKIVRNNPADKFITYFPEVTVFEAD
jgi:SAM-dependent methyltransferase